MYSTDECAKCSYYSRFIQDSNTWECELCHMIEAGYKDLYDSRNDIIWGRYLLQCGHQFHIRCLRVWCNDVKYVGCCTCGPIKEIETNQFCNICEVFGHATITCDKKNK